jgi:PPOX class probable F420-dependent enzyme
MAERPEPIADRMTWPGYEPPGERLLPWRWAVQRLTSTRRFWLATTRADGVPHAMPVWGVWHDDVVVFSTGRRTRKARNIRGDPRCVVTTEHADEAVVIEGVAAEVTDPAALRRADAAYRAKYGSSIFLGDSPVFAVRPTVVFGVIDGATDAWPTRRRFGSRDDPPGPCAAGQR